MRVKKMPAIELFEPLVKPLRVLALMAGSVPARRRSAASCVCIALQLFTASIAPSIAPSIA